MFKATRNMVRDFVLFFVCSWGLVDVKTVSVMEGDPVTLNTDLTEVQKYLLIQWMFGSTRIAEVDSLTNTNSTYDGPDERFRDRLELDHQTGSLTITNTRTSDSGLYKVTVISKETSYLRFSLTVHESTSSPERSSSSSFLSSRCVENNQTEDTNSTEDHQPYYIHCCGFTEAVIRLVVSALVGVTAVAFVVFDVRSSRSELNRTKETRFHRQIHGMKPDHQDRMSKSISSRYVC
ncbi:uncharacterized protein LOC122330439 [Puntigrus tetrazona]|uniref:uncharacterized protein LOC122330439 n=1 Tax=Puntigrus tetrazona TaxID=1606681 RepID=UPI001C8AA477|nr:uncharacterized protein LOC122330439 [Puntigrus tetrazona]